MEPDMFVSYELDLRGKQFEPVSLDAELRAAIGDAAYRGLSTYGYHKPVTVYIWGQPSDELAALIESVGAAHVGLGGTVELPPPPLPYVPSDPLLEPKRKSKKG